MKLHRVLILCAVVGGSAVAARQADAQVFNGYVGGWYGGLPYSVYSLDSVPYYALHPPVYYSHIVPRPYGYSPYAYPPNIMTPDRPPAAPQVMINPHVPSTPAKNRTESTRVAAVEPKTIINPYVVNDGPEPPAAVVRRAGRPAPKAVHPAALADASAKPAG